tara:strand:+ start:5001 stop:6371 length:1371 start_codon:yes stop_codon:yes gene_type:complete
MEAPYISAAILACNDEDHIARTLDSLKGVADEIVVVLDTKSTDRTEELIRNFASSCNLTLKPEDELSEDELWDLVHCSEGGELFLSKGFILHKRDWTHSFSEARNASLDACRGTWVIVLDADEDICPEDKEKVLPELRAAEEKGLNLLQSPLFVNPTYETPTQHSPEFDGFCSIHFRARVFRREAGIRYINRVHEQPVMPEGQEPKEDLLDVRFLHRGDQTASKSDYYRALLTLDHVDDPSDVIPAIYLADINLKDRKQERARQLLESIDIKPLAEGRQAPVASKYYATFGKVHQLHWAKRKAEAEAHGQDEGRELSDTEVELLDGIAKDSIICFAYGWKLSPMYFAAGIQAAVMMVISQGDHGVKTGAEIFSGIVEADPENVVASELLAFCTEYIKCTKGEEEADVVVAMYQQLISKLGVYLQELNALEQRSKLQANGLQPNIEPVALEQLKMVR